MSNSSASEDSEPVFRIDKFKVPTVARAEFLERVRASHQFVRTLPGFVRDAVFVQAGGPGAFNFISLVEWENAAALESATTAAAAEYRASGFNPKEFIARLSIEADIANNTQIKPVV